MIRRILAADHHHFENDWLSARWHFSFAEYHDPGNVNFGPLRVFNDDRVRPMRGFDLHPHREMEIITCVFSGTLEHEDDKGNKGRLGAGDVQVMSAGTGIVHAERNPSKDETLHLAQIWLTPWRRGVAPAWEQKSIPTVDRKGRLHPVVSREKNIKGTLGIHQDAVLYVADLDEGDAATHAPALRRRAYVFAAEGRGALNGVPMQAGDAARVEDEASLTLAGGPGFRVVLIDMV